MPRHGRSVFLYLSDLLGREVRGADGTRLGRVADLRASTEEGPYPRVRAVRLARHLRRQGHAEVSFDKIASIGPEGIRVEPGSSDRGARPAGGGGHTTPPPAGDLFLREDVLDRQVVDVHEARLRRVNDVHLLLAEGKLVAVHVDVGLPGLLRRLGFERSARVLARWIFDFEPRERLISWRYIQPVPAGEERLQSALRLSVTQRRLDRLHPADLADILEDLGMDERELVFRSLDPETAAETLENTEPLRGMALLQSLAPARAALVLQEMSADEATDLLLQLRDDDAEDLLARMNAARARQLRALRAQPQESAGAIMTTSFFRFPPCCRAIDALREIRRDGPDRDVYSVLFVAGDADRLLGVVSLRELLAAPGKTPLGEIMTQNVISVTAETRPKDVARLFSKYGFRAVPVVDADGRLDGVIRWKALIETVTGPQEARGSRPPGGLTG